MIYRRHSEELWWFVNEISPYMNQDKVNDWDTLLNAVLSMLPDATLDELEVNFHRVLRHCRMNVCEGVNRHLVVQLWIEMLLDNTHKER